MGQKTIQRNTKQAKWASTFTAAVVLVLGVLIFQQPMEVYSSIDPGLDSGNAVVDRTTVHGQTILIYNTVGNSTFKAPAGVSTVRVLVVGGGGGAGGLIDNPSIAITPGVSNTISVGGGGAGSTSRSARAANGSMPAGGGDSGISQNNQASAVIIRSGSP